MKADRSTESSDKSLFLAMILFFDIAVNRPLQLSLIDIAQ